MPKKLETVVVPLVEETPVISDIPADSEVEEEPKSIQKSIRPRTEKQKEAFLLLYTETNRGQSFTSRNPRARGNRESRDRCERGT